MRGPFGSKNRYEMRRVIRYFSCSSYDMCLDIANHKRWKTFTCKGCCELVGVDKDELTFIKLISNDTE